MTTTAGFTFRASWPIRDPNRTTAQLRVEASQHIDQLAADAGCRITGPITWTVRDHHLYAHAPAQPTRAGTQ